VAVAVTARRSRTLASVTVVVALGLIVLPGTVGSQVPGEMAAIDATRLQPVEARTLQLPSTGGASALDPAFVSSAALAADEPVLDPASAPTAASRVPVAGPAAAPGVIVIPVWRTDPEISWYGPGFYGRRTACGHAYTQTIMGVAHRSLPCGTRVTFKHGSRVVTVPVIDRGPYVAGRIFDLSAAACQALNHCYTGPILYRFP
jgi:hypothetical protein